MKIADASARVTRSEMRVFVQSNLLRREQIVALRQLGAGQRSIEIREGRTHFLGVRDPFDGVRKLDAGSVCIGAAEQEQRHGQQESRQDLDFDACESRELHIETDSLGYQPSAR